MMPHTVDDRSRLIDVAKAAALRNIPVLLAALRAMARSPEGLAASLRRHHLLRLVLGAVDTDTLSRALPVPHAVALEQWRVDASATARRLVATLHDVESGFREAGIDTLVLKGVVFAERLYGGLDRRPQHDIDLLVRQRDRTRAARHLAGRGFSKVGYDGHALTFAKGTAKLDVHFCLRGAPAYRIDEDAIWNDAVEVPLDGVTYRTLSDEWHLVLLAMSIFEELGQGSAKLRPIVDLYLLLRACDASIDWPAFFDRRDPERLTPVCVNVFDLVVAVFADRAELPALSRALDDRRALVVPLTSEARTALLFASARTPANLHWFGRVYPGRLVPYLVRFWLAGFPGNLRRLRPGRLASSARVAWKLRASGNPSRPRA